METHDKQLQTHLHARHTAKGSRATTKFKIGLQPQTTIQRLTTSKVTLGGQARHTNKSTQLEQNKRDLG